MHVVVVGAHGFAEIFGRMGVAKQLRNSLACGVFLKLFRHRDDVDRKYLAHSKADSVQQKTSKLVAILDFCINRFSTAHRTAKIVLMLTDLLIQRDRFVCQLAGASGRLAHTSGIVRGAGCA